MSKIKEFVDESLVIVKANLEQAVPLLQSAREQLSRMNTELHTYLQEEAEFDFDERLNNFQFSSMERIRVETAINQVETVIKLLDEFEKE